MPGFDQTGPDGQGPMTGRKNGKCSGNSIEVGAGQGRGLGRGIGRGAGKGVGNRSNRGFGNKNQNKGE